LDQYFRPLESRKRGNSRKIEKKSKESDLNDVGLSAKKKERKKKDRAEKKPKKERGEKKAKKEKKEKKSKTIKEEKNVIDTVVAQQVDTEKKMKIIHVSD